MKKTSLTAVIKANRAEIDKMIATRCPDLPKNDTVRRDWIMNDEGLYNWAKYKGARI